MLKYNISSKTLAILPSKDGGSIIFENDKSFKIRLSPTLIIKRNCINNGCTYEGRLKSSELLTGYKYKSPILLSEKDNLIYFPTNSPRLKDCAWICLNHIERIKKLDEGSVIVFNNKVSVKIITSFYILNKQILRATHLESKLRKNKC